MDQVIFAAEDIRRACALGIRSVLVADEGLFWLASEMKKAGELIVSTLARQPGSEGLGTDGRCQSYLDTVDRRIGGRDI